MCHETSLALLCGPCLELAIERLLPEVELKIHAAIKGVFFEKPLPWWEFEDLVALARSEFALSVRNRKVRCEPGAAAFVGAKRRALSYSRWRRAARRDSRETVPLEPELSSRLQSRLPSPERQLDITLRVKRLSIAISTLSNLEREVFVRFCYDGDSHKDIAEALGIGVDNSRQLYFRAMRKVRVILGPDSKLLGDEPE